MALRAGAAHGMMRDECGNCDREAGGYWMDHEAERKGGSGFESIAEAEKMSDVVNMPGVGVDDFERMVSELVLRQNTPEEIASVTGKDLSIIKRYLSSPRFVHTITQLADASGRTNPGSARALLKVAGFAAATKILQLIGSQNELTALKACTIALDYSLAKANNVDIGENEKMGSPDQVIAEKVKLEKELEVLRKQKAG